jgi:hypothetical protein
MASIITGNFSSSIQTIDLNKRGANHPSKFKCPIFSFLDTVLVVCKLCGESNRDGLSLTTSQWSVDNAVKQHNQISFTFTLLSQLICYFDLQKLLSQLCYFHHVHRHWIAIQFSIANSRASFI